MSTTTEFQARIDELMMAPHTMIEVDGEKERAAAALRLAKEAKAAGHELIAVSPFGPDERVRELADVYATTAAHSIETLTELALIQLEECFHPGNPITLIVTDTGFLEHTGDEDATKAVQTAVAMFLMRGHENGFRIRLIK